MSLVGSMSSRGGGIGGGADALARRRADRRAAGATCAASTGRSATLSSATRATVQTPVARPRATCAAAPASAKSPWRRDTSSKADAERGRRAPGCRSPTSSSPGSSAVANSPGKNRPPATVRLPCGFCSAEAARRAPASPPAVPPPDPRAPGCRRSCRACGSPRARRTASPRRRAAPRARRPRCARASRCRVMPPMCRPSLVCVHVRKGADAIRVDEHRRRRQPEIHRRDEALPAGQRLRVDAVLAEQRERFVDASTARGTRTRAGFTRSPCPPRAAAAAPGSATRAPASSSTLPTDSSMPLPDRRDRPADLHVRRVAHQRAARRSAAVSSIAAVPRVCPSAPLPSICIANRSGADLVGQRDGHVELRPPSPGRR